MYPPWFELSWSSSCVIQNSSMTVGGSPSSYTVTLTPSLFTLTSVHVRVIVVCMVELCKKVLLWFLV